MTQTAGKKCLVGDEALNLAGSSFEMELRAADLTSFPDQRKLKVPLDEAIWALWVLQDHFGHHQHVSAKNISLSLEYRGIALSELQIERALARAGTRISRRKVSNKSPTHYKVMQKGKDFLSEKYPVGNTRALVIAGNQPWTDRHVSIPEVAQELKGRVCVLDKFYGSASLGILFHFRHASPLHFLTAKTNENHAVFLRELKDLGANAPPSRLASIRISTNYMIDTFSPTTLRS